MHKSYETPSLFKAFPDLVAIETTRHGGLSPVPYSSLNLGKNTDDAPGNIAQNREVLCGQLGISWSQVAYGKQVHGSAICNAYAAGRYEGFDAFMTNQRGLFVAITVADCTPILIYDPVRQVVAAAHAGWRGAAAHIGTRVLEAMTEQYGSQPQDCLIYIGTCIGFDHFEVGSEVVAEFPSAYARPADREGKFYLDLRAAIRHELLEAGVAQAHLEVSKFCTVTHNDHYFSHRKEQGTTGRFMGLIGLRE